MIAIDQLKQKFLKEWQHCPCTGYTLQNSIPEKYLKNNISTFLKSQIAEKKIPANLQRVKNQVMPEMRAFANDYLKMSELDTEQYCAALSAFVEQAKAFDPHLSNSDIYQAGRNVLTMYVTQDLFDLEIALTPSVFAYSLLYPYTDNYLDNPQIDFCQKKRFNNRLAKKLSGMAIEPDNTHENTVYTLIDMIEEQYPRSGYPRVYQSLQLIHRAQCTSIRLYNNQRLTPCDILEICFEKGGTSVLADGFLVAGTLTDRQQEYLFGMGIYLQLLDDLQDITDDMRTNISTFFSHYAQQQPIDAAVNRFLYFGERVLGCPPDKKTACLTVRSNSHQKISQLLFLNTAQKIFPYFSDDYQAYLKSFLKN